MKKFISILFLICAPILAFGQNSSFKGFYQAQFFNVFGEVKIIRADFEVKADNTIVGILQFGADTEIIQGQVTAKGKFEVRTPVANNTVTIIKGEFPVTKNNGKVSLIQRTEQKGNGSKSVSENGISGFIKQFAPPVELKDVGIIDNGKTQLWFQQPNPLFDKEWSDAPTTVKISNIAGRVIEIELRSEATNPARRFTLRLNFRQADQKIWSGADIPKILYAERQSDSSGKLEGFNLFTGRNSDTTSGQIELVSEGENEMVFKITNLKVQETSGEDFVQIDGYIHAVKNKG